MSAVIDSHVHLLPDRLTAAIRRFFAANLSDEFAYPSDPTAALETLAGAGIREVWNLPYAHKPGVAQGLNASMSELAVTLADRPVRVVSGATVHPEDRAPEEDLARAVDRHGARVLKLHCSVGSYGPGHPRLDPVYEAAGEMGVPIVIHAGHAIDGTTSTAELAPLAGAARRHPETTFIVAHAGAPAVETTLSMMRELPNVWADLTPVVDGPVAVTAAALRTVLDRVLMGSDAPNTPFGIDFVLTWIDGLGLTAGELEAVTGANGNRLLGSG